jgi:hypoxanthine phosphoribosyltransferase
MHIPFKHRVLIAKAKIEQKVQELASIINQDYENADPLVVIVVMKGAVLFAADLLKNLTIPTRMEFIGISSYSGTQSSGQVRITHDLTADIKGQDVLLIEDIIDSGITLDYLLKTLKTRKPKSIKVCSFLSKPKAHQVKVPIDYFGFEISNEFVIGYGLDLDEKYRNLPDLLQIIDDTAT